MKLSLTSLALIFLTSTSLFAADAKKPEEGAPPNTDFFRCVRMTTSSIADLKARMITECNLSKPFSFTGSETLTSDSIYTFCCHRQ